jgi:hypothetical protein
LLDLSTRVREACVRLCSWLQFEQPHQTAQQNGPNSWIYPDGVSHRTAPHRIRQPKARSGVCASRVCRCPYPRSAGATYTGSVVQGQRHGSGTYMFANGSRYLGEYLHDLKVRRLCRTHQIGMACSTAAPRTPTVRPPMLRTHGAAS